MADVPGRSQGVVRFRDKLWALGQRPAADAMDEATRRLLHRTIKKVTGDLEGMAFNTAISAMMVLANHLAGLDAVPREALSALTLLVSPYHPPTLGVEEPSGHLQGHTESLAHEPWPTWDEALCVDDLIEMAVQVNGKVRGRVTLPRAASARTTPAPRRPRRRGRRRPHRGQAGEEVHLRPGQDHQPRRRLRLAHVPCSRARREKRTHAHRRGPPPDRLRPARRSAGGGRPRHPGRRPRRP